MRLRRRRAALVAPLAATALGLGLGTGAAGAASVSRTDTFTFTNRAGTSVTCTVESFLDLSDTGDITASTTLSGPADCTATRLSISLQYTDPDRRVRFSTVAGEGRSLSTTIDALADSVHSNHGLTVPACDCSPSYDLHRSK